MKIWTRKGNKINRYYYNTDYANEKRIIKDRGINEYDINEEIRAKIRIWNEGVYIQIKNETNKIDFKIDGKLANMNHMFNAYSSLIKIKFISVDISNVSRMRGMLLGCEELKCIDLSSFHTSNATHMSFMFWNCSKLKEIKGIYIFDTSKV